MKYLFSTLLLLILYNLFVFQKKLDNELFTKIKNNFQNKFGEDTIFDSFYLTDLQANKKGLTKDIFNQCDTTYILYCNQLICGCINTTIWNRMDTISYSQNVTFRNKKHKQMNFKKEDNLFFQNEYKFVSHWNLAKFEYYKTNGGAITPLYFFTVRIVRSQNKQNIDCQYFIQQMDGYMP